MRSLRNDHRTPRLRRQIATQRLQLHSGKRSGADQCDPAAGSADARSRSVCVSCQRSRRPHAIRARSRDGPALDWRVDDFGTYDRCGENISAVQEIMGSLGRRASADMHCTRRIRRLPLGESFRRVHFSARRNPATGKILAGHHRRRRRHACLVSAGRQVGFRGSLRRS